MHPPQNRWSSAVRYCACVREAPRPDCGREERGTRMERDPGPAETASLRPRPPAALLKFPFEGVTSGAAAWTGSDVLAPG